MTSSDMKTQIDTANSAIKLLQPILDRAEKWRFGQRLVAGAAMITVAATLIFGVSDVRYTAAAVFLVMGLSFLTRDRVWLAARHLVLKDENGRARAVLTTSQNQPNLSLLDDSGEVRTRLGLSPEGTPSLAMLDSSTKPRAIVTADPDTAPAFALFDPQGRQKVAICLSAQDSSGMLALLSHEGTPQLLLGSGRDQSIIVARDDSGNIVWSIPEKPPAPASTSQDATD